MVYRLLFMCSFLLSSIAFANTPTGGSDYTTVINRNAYQWCIAGYTEGERFVNSQGFYSGVCLNIAKLGNEYVTSSTINSNSNECLRGFVAGEKRVNKDRYYVRICLKGAALGDHYTTSAPVNVQRWCVVGYVEGERFVNSSKFYSGHCLRIP